MTSSGFKRQNTVDPATIKENTTRYSGMPPSSRPSTANAPSTKGIISPGSTHTPDASKKNRYSLWLSWSIDVVSSNRTTYIPYFLAPPYSEAGLAHCLCESPLDATDPKPSSDRLEHGEARQYCSTLVRCWSMQDSIEPSHLVVKAAADVILNPEGHITSNNNNR